MLASTLISTAFFAVAAVAAGPSATVVIEARPGGAGSDLTNTTVTIELNSVYKNSTALSGASALYLTGASGVPENSVICTPFSGSQTPGPTCTSAKPSDLDKVDFTIATIVCISNSILNIPPGAPASSTAASTTLVTHTPTGHSVVTSVTRVTAGTPSAQAASTASPSASQSAGNAASGLYLSGEFFGGLALAGFGVAFAL